MHALCDTNFFSSWSGGKDSCLALYKARQAGGKAAALLTMMTEQGDRTRGHGLNLAVIEAQAEAMSISLLAGSASWDDYEETYSGLLAGLKEQGIENGVFGDIDLEPHREWVEKICARHDMIPFLPLWLRERRDLLREFIDAGFAATIIAVKDEKLDRSFLGRQMSWETIEALEKAGVDACGEEGEYHTVVTDGPLFSQALSFKFGDEIRHDGYSFLDVVLH